MKKMKNPIEIDRDWVFVKMAAFSHTLNRPLEKAMFSDAFFIQFEGIKYDTYDKYFWIERYWFFNKGVR